jgi:hypothetical protein
VCGRLRVWNDLGTGVLEAAEECWEGDESGGKEGENRGEDKEEGCGDGSMTGAM